MKLFGIIGKELSHSYSPKLYNAVFKKLKSPCRYLSFQVEKRHLKNLILCMKLVDLQGLNVTLPFKEAVLPLLDGLSPSAKQCGAVNTIVRRKNKFLGYNTDGLGFVTALREKKNFNPKGKHISILGAGGAARGIAAALADSGAKEILFFGRHLKRAKRAGLYLKKSFPKTKWRALSPSQKNYRGFFPSTELLIQATPALLHLPLKFLPKKALVSDIIYHPDETKLLKEAKRLGLKTLDGLWMFVYQASLNLKLWVQLNCDPARLRKIIL